MGDSLPLEGEARHHILAYLEVEILHIFHQTIFIPPKLYWHPLPQKDGATFLLDGSRGKGKIVGGEGDLLKAVREGMARWETGMEG